MARVIENLENAFEEMFDFITDLPSGLDGFESDFDAAFEELKELKATLTPPNEWVSRVQELDELYTKLQIVTGFTAEQLLEMFAAGYTLKKPDYSKHFEDMANLAESDPPNEPLTLEQLREMDGDPVWIVDVGPHKWYEPGWAIVDRDNCLVRTVKNWNAVFFEKYGERWLAYRRPKEEQ